MSRRLEAIIDRMAGKAVAALDLHGDEPGMATRICRTCHVPQPCPTSQVLNDNAVQILEDHDEQVRADERARVSVVHSTLTDEQLVDELVRRGVLEEKVASRWQPVRVPCDCEHPTHARLVGDDSLLTHVTTEVVSVVRYASRWQPDTRTDEQRSDDAITTLRRRLTEEPTHG
ncbi:hypothetical protein [Janibacter melonis]|uniref:hypothetical protein n=1 Tax=Janibacter melonis TaxID=262209 RepID=UPI001749ACC1|nr:hypothetical protein [Janibacter melonis]